MVIDKGMIKYTILDIGNNSRECGSKGMHFYLWNILMLYLLSLHLKSPQMIYYSQNILNFFWT